MDNGTVSFYKNGINQRVAFSGLKSLERVSIAVGTYSYGSLTINFDATPFKYSISKGLVFN